MIFAPALVGALTSCRPVAQKEIVVSIPADGRWDRFHEVITNATRVQARP